MADAFEISTSHNKIAGIMSMPKGRKKYPCIILSHGLVSSMESSKYLALSERLNSAGIATCRFDYHGCGESGGNLEETTLTIRTDNLNSVVEYVVSHNFIDSEKLGILGSSFGGSTCIVQAARDKRIKCISLWATPYKLEKKEDGMISDIHFKESIYEDFSSYDLLSEAKKISHALVIHGQLDEIVPYHEGQTIYKCILKPKNLEIMKGADHIFSNLPHREKAINMSLNWFRRYFLGN